MQSSQIEISDLNSLFELFVVYTFAYNSLQPFQNHINKSSVKTMDDKIKEFSKKVAKESDDYATLLKINNNSEIIKTLLGNSVNSIQPTLKALKDVKQVAENIYSGLIYRPLFYLTGAIYLIYIVLGAFQDYVGNTTIFFTTVSTTIAVYLFHWHYSYTILRHYKTVDLDKIELKYETKKAIKLFIVIILIVFVIASFISMYIHNNYGVFKDECDKIFLFIFTRKEWAQIISVASILSIAALPYWTFYKRERDFAKGVEDKFSEIENKLSQEIKDLQGLSNVTSKYLKPNNLKPIKATPSINKPVIRDTKLSNPAGKTNGTGKPEKKPRKPK